MPYSFRGGIRPEPHKEETRRKNIELPPQPETVVIPLSMHIGAPCAPSVSPGDRVRVGQKIGDSDAPLSAPVHASVSGTVRAVEYAPDPSGEQVLSVVIDNDGQDLDGTAAPPENWENLSPEELIALVREAGVVGYGTPIPTHAQLHAVLGRADTLIIDGVECEPYITSGHRTVIEHADEVVGGVRVLLHLFPGADCHIAVDEGQEDALGVLRRAVGSDRRIRLTPLRARYPQSAERLLIRAVTGREVPPGRKAADARCAVFDVGTAGAVFRAVVEGRPMTRRVVTVAGSAIANPKNLDVRIGTPLRALAEAAGGFIDRPQRFLMGGPMTGTLLRSKDVPAVKSTGAFLAFLEPEERPGRHTACIRCGRCAEVCPMRLLPAYLYLYAQRGLYGECERLRIADCIECGCCSYECPAGLRLAQTFRAAKASALEPDDATQDSV